MHESKPCPFCGGQPEMDNELCYWRACCPDCFAQGPEFIQRQPVSGEDAAREAWAAWNHRAPDSPADEAKKDPAPSTTGLRGLTYYD